MCTININTLEVNRQVFWQPNYSHSSLLANLDSYITLPSHPKWIFEQLRLEEEVKAKKDENIDKPNPSNPKEFDIDHKEGIIKI